MQILFLNLVLMPLWGASGLSSSSASGYVSIVGHEGATQALPTDYVQRFDRWIIDLDNRLVKANCRFPVDNVIQGDSNLQARTVLDIVIKRGTPSYILAGLQVRQQGGKDEQSQCPLAHQWTTFSYAVEPSFRLETFVREGNGAYQEFLRTSEDRMKDSIQSFGIVVSQLDDSSPLSSGFHIVSVPLEYEWKDLPSVFGQLSIVSLATAEPDARQLLDIGETLIEMTASSVLNVTISAVGALEDS